MREEGREEGGEKRKGEWRRRTMGGMTGAVGSTGKDSASSSSCLLLRAREDVQGSYSLLLFSSLSRLLFHPPPISLSLPFPCVLSPAPSPSLFSSSDAPVRTTCERFQRSKATGSLRSLLICKSRRQPPPAAPPPPPPVLSLPVALAARSSPSCRYKAKDLEAVDTRKMPKDYSCLLVVVVVDDDDDDDDVCY
eukprot:706912-Hanusia_phi.AAC.1